MNSDKFIEIQRIREENLRRIGMHQSQYYKAILKIIREKNL